MSSTTQKHRSFLSEPMRNKSVRDLAGVGDIFGRRLEAAGFDKAYKVLGIFLILDKNKHLFQLWMKEKCDANPKHSGDCYQCLYDWSEQFL